MTGRLLIRIGQLDQQRLAPRASQQLDADRQAIGGVKPPGTTIAGKPELALMWQLVPAC
jgi:hypothetical protein